MMLFDGIYKQPDTDDGCFWKYGVIWGNIYLKDHATWKPGTGITGITPQIGNIPGLTWISKWEDPASSLMMVLSANPVDLLILLAWETNLCTLFWGAVDVFLLDFAFPSPSVYQHIIVLCWPTWRNLGYIYIVIPQNRGTPKSSILLGFSMK